MRPNENSCEAAGGGNSNPPWVRRVYIVDDHPFFTFALTSLVNSEADLSVCGSGKDEATMIADVERLGPDLVVMDLQISSNDGLMMAAALRRAAKQVPILFASSLQAPQFGLDSRLLEPCSFVEKTTDPADIIKGIRRTLEKLRVQQRQSAASNILHTT